MSKSDCWELLGRLREAPPAYRANLLLIGPPGTGKTYLAGVLAEADGLPFYSVTTHGRTLPSDLLYAPWLQSDGSAVLQFRPGLRAWGVGDAPGVLVVNEVDEASDDALLALGALLDDPKSARITLPDGETVSPAEGFRCIATSNASIRSLPERLLDRFPIRVLIDTPAPEILKVLRPDTCAAVTGLYASLGWTLDKTGGAPLFSVREARAYDALRDALGDPDAARLVWGERADTIRDQIRLAAQAS